MIGAHGMSAADRAASHASRGPCREPLGDQRPQGGTGGDAVAIRREPRVVGELRRLDRGAEARPLPLGPHRDDDLPVARGEGLVRDDVRMGVAPATRRRPRDEGVLRLVDQHGQGGCEQGDVDALAAHGTVRAASQEPGQDPDGGKEPGDDIADRDPDLGRVTAVGVRVPGDGHQPPDRLDHEVVSGAFRSGAVGPVSADGEVDEVGVEVAQGLLVESESCQRSRSEVFDEDVRVNEQAAQDFGAGRLPDIQSRPTACFG